MLIRSITFLLIAFMFTGCGSASESDQPIITDERGDDADSQNDNNSNEVIVIPPDEESNESEETTVPINYSWSAPELLESEGGEAGLPSVDINSQGDTVVAWTQKEGTAVNVHVTYISSTGAEITSTLNDPLTKSKIAESNYIYYKRPYAVVSINETGQAFTAWTSSLIEESNMNGAYVASFNLADNSWNAPVQISSEANSMIDMKINDSGMAAIVWTQASGNGNQLFISQYSNANATWSDPILLSTGSISSPQVALTSTGHSVIVFEEYSSELSANHIYAMEVDASGVKSSKHKIDTQASSAGELIVNINDDNQIAVSWLQDDDLNEQTDPWVASYSSGAWTEAVKINSEHGTTTIALATVINDGGDMLAVWIDGSTTAHNNRDLFSATVSSDSGVGALEIVGENWARVPSISNSGSGEVLVAWGTSKLKAYSDGEWSNNGFLQGAYARPGIKIASASNGKAVASWLNSEGGSKNLFIARRY